MNKKKIEELPAVGDVVVFQLNTFAHKYKLASNPYSFDSITIHYIGREVINSEPTHYKTAYNKEIENEISRLSALCVKNPSQNNLDELERAKVRLEATSIKCPYAFQDSTIVFSTGNSNKPLWVGENTLEIKNINHGVFEFEWDTTVFKEGNYYIVWSWVNEKGGEKSSSQKTFSLHPMPMNSRLSLSKPVPNDKYDFLIKKYLASMYKTKVAEDDITSKIFDGLNWCIARELSYLENTLMTLTECYDANLCPPTMLPLLVSFYNMRLKSDNVTLHRRQASNAIPLLKMKGTKLGLETALDQIGVKLKKLTLLWQVRSPYTWTESFTVEHDDQGIFELNNYPIDDKCKVEIHTRARKYIDMPSNLFSTVDMMETGKKALIYNGDESKQIRFLKGDILKITYQIQEMPESYKQIEDYIQALPLADNRDETKQTFPIKNWNVHLIEEDDPLFDIIIKDRHPFHDPLTYGKIRTTFLFSENVYNMDTFNGSLRESKEPCDIDRRFVDNCTSCQSSKFNVDIEVQELSDERIAEALEIIREYSPFHAQLNVVNICGAVNEFIIMPQEEIELSLDYSVIETDGFTETMEHGEEVTCLIEYNDGHTERLNL